MRYLKVKLDTARSKVDRIAFCGQVPVNVYNSNVGDYILPILNDDNSITGVSISSSSITFDQYKSVVGKVLNIR